MTFSYFPNVPGAANDPADDQPQMQVNTQSISNIIDVDHVGFNTPNGGFHEKVTFNANTAAPGFGTGVSALFANLGSGGISQPFWQNSAGSREILSIAAQSLAGNGYLRLENGLTIQWGAPAVVTGNGSFNFPIGFTTQCYVVVITPIRNSSNVDIVYVVNYNTAGCNYRNTAAGISQVTYIAIGV